jgi:hypothetical protein
MSELQVWWPFHGCRDPLTVATPTSCSSASPEVSEIPSRRLDFLRHLDSRHGKIHHDDLSGMLTGMESRFYCVGSAAFLQACIDTCQRSANVSSCLHLQVYCAHGRKDHLVGEISDFALLTSDRDRGK